MEPGWEEISGIGTGGDIFGTSADGVNISITNRRINGQPTTKLISYRNHGDFSTDPLLRMATDYLQNVDGSLTVTLDGLVPK